MKLSCLLASAAVLALLAQPASANTRDNISDSPFTGPYLGVYGGYDWSDADAPGGLNPDVNGWDGGVFAGFRIDGLLDRMNGLGIGLGGALEGFYGVSNADGNIGGVGIEKENEWGISFRPGLSFLDDTFGLSPYGILGYRNTEFEAFSGVAGASERFDGFELGIGAQVLAMGDFGVRLEYSHTWYGSEGGIDPDADDVRLGLSYHF